MIGDLRTPDAFGKSCAVTAGNLLRQARHIETLQGDAVSTGSRRGAGACTTRSGCGAGWW